MFGLNKEDINNIQPKWKSKVKLFPHQIKTIKDIEEAEGKVKYYYLGDMTGFGKTLSIMGLIYRTNDRYISCDRMYHTEKYKPQKFKLRDIYITPLHLFKQVCDEATKCKIHYRKFKHIADCDIDYLELDEEIDLLIISCTMLQYFLKHSFQFPFYRIIIDEADTIQFRTKELFLPFVHYRNLCLVSATFGHENLNSYCVRMGRIENISGASLMITDYRVIPHHIKDTKFIETKKNGRCDN